MSASGSQSGLVRVWRQRKDQIDGAWGLLMAEIRTFLLAC